MSKIDELIQTLCPDGVEYKKIRDVYTRLRGTPITAGKMKEIADENGDVRIFAGGKTVINAFEKDIPKANITRVPAVLVQSRGVIDFVYYDKPFTFKNEMWAYTHENTMSVQYLCYVLKNNAQTFRNEASGMGSMPQISLSVTEDFEIPVPPISVQEEIVRILDEYTELEAELEAKLSEEIKLKQKQYKVYRDELLMFGDDVERKRLGDVADVISGYPFDSSQFKNYGVKLMRGVNVKRGTFNFNDSDDRYWETDDGLEQYYLQQLDIVISMDGSLVGKNFGFFDLDIPMLLVQRVARIRTYDMDSRFLWHWICTNFSVYVDSCKTKGAIPHISLRNIRDFIVPVPSPTEQERIVKILDKFDTYTRDMISALNTELESRKKRYAYYRDQLLTFKRKE